MNRLSRAANLMLLPVRFLTRDRKAGLRLPFKDQLRAWRYGFNRKTYIIYQLQKNDIAFYISDIANFTGAKGVNSVYNPCIRNKLNFSKTLELYGITTPHLHAHVLKGVVHAANGAKLDSTVPDVLKGLPEVEYPIAFKPSFGGAGKGIFFLDRKDGGFWINGIRATEEDLTALVRSLNHYMVTEYVKQASYAARIYPGTANTLRILTLWDVDNNEPYIAAAAHRFGTSRVTPIDNFHGGLGGLSCRIDPETGVIGPGATVSETGELTWHAVHPETGEPIEGVPVPRWETISRELLELAGRMPYAPCVGWDLVVTETGWNCLEGNSPPGLFVWQVHGPLLTDPRTRRFYEAHSVIEPRN